MVTFPLFQFLRYLLVLLTGKGFGRSKWMNDLHHKLSFRLHKILPMFGITGIQRIPAPGMDGKFIYVRAEDGGVAHQLIVYRDYEPYQSSLVRKYIKPGMTVYNIGANIGYYVLLASECVGINGKVYGFEPAPQNFELLQKNIFENKLANVEIFPMAVGAAPGSATLSLSLTNSGDHQLQEIHSRDHVVVSVTSIDSFIAEGHAAPDVIIMDVQGAELDVLRGASSVLTSEKWLVLFTEFWPRGLDERHPNGAKEMLQLLDEADLQQNIIDEKSITVRKTSQEDILAGLKGNEEANLLCVR